MCKGPGARKREVLYNRSLDNEKVRELRLRWNDLGRTRQDYRLRKPGLPSLWWVTMSASLVGSHHIPEVSLETRDGRHGTHSHSQLTSDDAQKDDTPPSP